jgi:hypothetical protein
MATYIFTQHTGLQQYQQRNEEGLSRAKPTSHTQLDEHNSYFWMEHCHQHPKFSFHFLCINESRYSEAGVYSSHFLED